MHFSWSDAPPSVRAEVVDVIDGLEQILPNSLIGTYLHGSLAMGCFNPEQSDIDLLVVAETEMRVEEKRRLALHLLETSINPVAVEITVLSQRHLHPWTFPTSFDFHYSEMWRRQYEEDLRGDAWLRWNNHRQVDLDLAAHVTVARGRGLALSGRLIEEVFPTVPRDDYLASILGDYREAYRNSAKNPMYSILILGRVYRFLVDGTIASKKEAGEWLLTVLPPECLAVVQEALARYRGERTGETWVPDELQAYVATIDNVVMPLVPATLRPILARSNM